MSTILPEGGQQTPVGCIGSVSCKPCDDTPSPFAYEKKKLTALKKIKFSARRALNIVSKRNDHRGTERSGSDGDVSSESPALEDRSQRSPIAASVNNLSNISSLHIHQAMSLPSPQGLLDISLQSRLLRADRPLPQPTPQQQPMQQPQPQQQPVQQPLASATTAPPSKPRSLLSALLKRPTPSPGALPSSSWISVASSADAASGTARPAAAAPSGPAQEPPAAPPPAHHFSSATEASHRNCKPTVEPASSLPHPAAGAVERPQHPAARSLGRRHESLPVPQQSHRGCDTAPSPLLSRLPPPQQQQQQRPRRTTIADAVNMCLSAPSPHAAPLQSEAVTGTAAASEPDNGISQQLPPEGRDTTTATAATVAVAITAGRLSPALSLSASVPKPSAMPLAAAAGHLSPQPASGPYKASGQQQQHPRQGVPIIRVRSPPAESEAVAASASPTAGPAAYSAPTASSFLSLCFSSGRAQRVPPANPFLEPKTAGPGRQRLLVGSLSSGPAVAAGSSGPLAAAIAAGLPPSSSSVASPSPSPSSSTLAAAVAAAAADSGSLPVAAAAPVTVAAGGGSGMLLATSKSAPAAMRRSVWSLKDYSLQKRLYKGKMSSVYKARCLRSELPVALKVYFKSRVPANVVHMVLREVSIHLLASEHRSVLKLYGVFQTEEIVVLVMELASRGSLADICQGVCGGRLSEAQVRQTVLEPLLDALSYLHATGVCHRDIKPENLLFTSEWGLRLADFGVSINLLEERAVTRAGTADYMAPEVERCPLKMRPEENKDDASLAYTTAADVWSVGVLAYELLVGFPPMVGSGALSFPTSVSAGARHLIASALAQMPEERPTVRQLRCHPWMLQQQQQNTDVVSSTAAAAAGSGCTDHLDP